MISSALISAALLVVASASISGRPVDSWSDSRLWKEADAVVIAIPERSSSRNVPGAKASTWVSVRTPFAVQAVLKGSDVGKRLTLLHYRYQGPRAAIEEIDGPGFVSFEGHSGSRYLLFLRAPKIDQNGAETAFEPLSGQMDPGLSMSRLIEVR